MPDLCDQPHLVLPGGASGSLPPQNAHPDRGFNARDPNKPNRLSRNLPNAGRGARANLGARAPEAASSDAQTTARASDRTTPSDAPTSSSPRAQPGCVTLPAPCPISWPRTNRPAPAESPDSIASSLPPADGKSSAPRPRPRAHACPLNRCPVNVCAGLRFLIEQSRDRAQVLSSDRRQRHHHAPLLRGRTRAAGRVLGLEVPGPDLI
jgi:hypothetical protein